MFPFWLCKFLHKSSLNFKCSELFKSQWKGPNRSASSISPFLRCLWSCSLLRKHFSLKKHLSFTKATSVVSYPSVRIRPSAVYLVFNAPVSSLDKLDDHLVPNGKQTNCTASSRLGTPDRVCQCHHPADILPLNRVNLPENCKYCFFFFFFSNVCLSDWWARQCPADVTFGEAIRQHHAHAALHTPRDADHLLWRGDRHERHFSHRSQRKLW